MANTRYYGWMTPTTRIDRQRLPTDYQTATHSPRTTPQAVQVDGIVYVEADARYDAAGPGTSRPNETELSTWLARPLDELCFLRSLVEGQESRSSTDPEKGPVVAGLVIWAPMDRSTELLADYLRLAKETLGERPWRRVKGIRFLLQAIRDQEEFEELVTSEAFVANLRLLGRMGLAFDVGVDQRSGGVWQLEAIAGVLESVHEGCRGNGEEKTAFVLNHLCKPDFALDPESHGFERWCKAMRTLGKMDRTYMKFSGALNELPESSESMTAAVQSVQRWVEHVLKCFGPERVMFGSDWPVCNVGRPEDEERWGLWIDVVGAVLSAFKNGLSPHQQDCIWRLTAIQAYNLDME